MTLWSVLSVAGSDSSGGAGIQADIKTVAAHHMYAMTAVTAVTAQNTLGVQHVYVLPPEEVALQIESVCSDIFPDAVKTGMMCCAGTVSAAARLFASYGVRHLVVDPVCMSTSGRELLDADGRNAMMRELFPLAELITPNIGEEEMLHDGLCAARCAILVKGGHAAGGADDVLYRDGSVLAKYPPARVYADIGAYEDADEITIFRGERIDNGNTHGTGCTLSSAVACALASGRSLEAGVRSAKAYVAGAIGARLAMGHGRGPLDHCWQMDGTGFQREV